jgi:TonB family protein
MNLFHKLLDSRTLNELAWWWVPLPLDMIMTRSLFLAALALTPALVHAQSTPPAQTATPTVLQARVAAPANVKSVPGKDSSSSIRVSTGIVAPKLIKKLDLTNLPGLNSAIIAKDVTVVVDLVVDPTGKTGNLSIEKSAGTIVDQEVLAAVSQFRYQPGTLDGQSFAVPVRLEVFIQHTAE